MSRVAQYISVKKKYDNALKAGCDEEQVSLLLDELDEIFESGSDHERTCMKALFTRPDDTP